MSSRSEGNSVWQAAHLQLSSPPGGATCCHPTRPVRGSGRQRLIVDARIALVCRRGQMRFPDGRRRICSCRHHQVVPLVVIPQGQFVDLAVHGRIVDAWIALVCRRGQRGYREAQAAHLQLSSPPGRASCHHSRPVRGSGCPSSDSRRADRPCMSSRSREVSSLAGGRICSCRHHQVVPVATPVGTSSIWPSALS